MKTETKKNTTPGANELPEDANIDKIRDILFGVQMRDTDRKFSKIEERLSKEIEEMRDESRKRLDILENFIKQEIASLSERLVKEQNLRGDSIREVNTEMKSFSHEVDKKFSEFGEQTAKSQSELRQQLLAQSKDLSDEIHKRHTEVLGSIERESSELQSDKADRSALAGLFTEMAMRLTDDFKLPSGD